MAVTVRRLDRAEPDYRMFSPSGTARLPGIIVLGGGDGGIGVAAAIAEKLGPHGYLVMALAFFKHGDLPKKLIELDIEYFDDALAELRAHPRFDPAAGIGLYGVSKGAEIGLLLAARHSDIRAVIAAGPSDVVWESPHHNAPEARHRSSWASGGKPLPFVAFYKAPHATSIERHTISLDRAADREACRIPVERMNTALLLLSGEKDGVWPSRFMTDRIVDRLKAAGYPHAVEHICVPRAGHNVYPLFHLTDRLLMAALIRLFGGDYRTNRKAQKQLWPCSLAFFAEHLAPRD